MIREPGGEYIGHVTPANGNGSEIAKCIINYLKIMILTLINWKRSVAMAQRQTQGGKMVQFAIPDG